MCEIQLNHEEQLMAIRVNQYFRSPEMNLGEKLRHAIILADYELELGNYSSLQESQHIFYCKDLLNRLLLYFT